MSIRSCSTCKYGYANKELGKGNMECRFNPPIVYTHQCASRSRSGPSGSLLEKSPVGTSAVQETQFVNVFAFPIVSSTTGWCGKWEKGHA